MEEIAKKDEALPPAQPTIRRRVPGMEQVDDADVRMPRLKLNQDKSPLVKANIARDGDFSNSLSEHVFGKEVIIQPVIYSKTRIKWFEASAEEVIWECRSYDGKRGDKYGSCYACEFKQWGETPPLCNEIHNFLSVIREPKEADKELIMVSFLRTSATAGVNLINKILFAGTVPWARLYKVYSQHVSKGKYDYYIMKVDPGQPSDKQQIEFAEKVYKYWEGKKVDVDYKDESNEFSDKSEEEYTDADLLDDKESPYGF